jgi:ubiquinone/menaquinone biosynthesis C-methylase UbiE
MAWYDLFANFYDVTLDDMYRHHRQRAIAALELAPGMTVVDVGCGTGASLSLLVDAVGPSGRVIGLDASPGMLRKAAARIRKNGWTNVELIQVDSKATTVGASLPRSIASVDRVLCFLSLSVIANWQAVLDHWYAALAPGGRLTIADVHNARPGLYARLVELISRATLQRKSWLPLEQRAARFQLRWLPSSWFIGGRFFVAAGSRAPAHTA